MSRSAKGAAIRAATLKERYTIGPISSGLSTEYPSAFWDTGDAFLPVSRIGAPEANKRAFGILQTQAKPLHAKYLQAAKRLATFNQDLAAEATKSINSSVATAQKTAELVREIAAASAEQNSGAAQINKAIQQLDQVIQQNSASSEEMASAAEELSSQAEVLQTTIAYFNTGETRQPGTAPSRRSVRTRSGAARKTPPSRSTAIVLSQMQRAIKGTGASIELDTNNGGADSHDREFTTYES